MTNSLTITSITPLEKRPCHPKYAAARGAIENYETVVVLKGFTNNGHIHGPIVHQGRHFRPFAQHIDEDAQKHTCTVQVLLDDPKNPYGSGDTGKYPGQIQMYENVCEVRRSRLGTKFVPRQLQLTLVEPITQKTSKLHLKSVIAWRSGSDSTQPQGTDMMPFSLKAVEFTAKEIDAHTKQAKLHERIPL